MAALLNLPLEVLTSVCQQLDLRDLACVAKTCKPLRHGDGGQEKAEMPSKSPVLAALCERAFPLLEVSAITRPAGCCSESWVAYLTRCARQRRCWEAPTLAVGDRHSLLVDAGGRLLGCGQGVLVGHGDADKCCFEPTPVAVMAGVRVRSVAVAPNHCLALCWDGRVYSWGENNHDGWLGHGDQLERRLPTLVQDLEGVCGIAVGCYLSLAVTQSGEVFTWGHVLQPHDGERNWRRLLRPSLSRGLGVCACAE